MAFGQRRSDFCVHTDFPGILDSDYVGLGGAGIPHWS